MKLTDWLKANPLIAGGVILGAILLFFPKILKGIFGGSTRVRHRRRIATRRSNPVHRRNVRRAITGSSRPRIRRRNKGAKKPWQVKGSLAAKRHMALIRKRR